MEFLPLFRQIKTISLFALVFLLPLFFIPFWPASLDFQKLSLFIFFLLFLSLGFFGEQIFSGKFKIKESKIFYSLFLFSLFFLALSLFFSLSRFQSFFPSIQNPLDNFLTLFLLFSFLFLIANNSFEKAEIFLFLFLFLLSFGLLGILNILQIFIQIKFFTPLVTSGSLAVCFSFLAPLYFVFLEKARGAMKIFFGFLFLVFLLNLVLIGYKPAWGVLVLEIMFISLFLFNKERKLGFFTALLLFVLLTLGLFFYFFPLRIFNIFPPEISLPFLAQMNLISRTWQNPKMVLIGSGPGTFLFQFLQKKPLFLNQTIFWGTKLTQGFSFFFDSFITKGLLFALSLFCLILFSFFLFFKDTLSQKLTNEEIFLFGSFFGTSIAFLFLPANFILVFAFFFLLGVLFSNFLPQREIALSLPEVFIVNLFFVLFVSLLLFSIFWTGKILTAEFFYQKGAMASQKGEIDKAIEYLQRATRINDKSDLYFRDLSQAYLFKVSIALQKGENFQTFLSNSLDSIEKAIRISPFNSSNWNVRGFIFRNLLNLEGAKELALQSYQRAIELEPSSPFPYGEKGRVYILAAQKLAKEGKEEEKNENLRLAKENLKKAIELKGDYSPAFYLLAVAADQEGNLKEAIEFLEKATLLNPQNPVFHFQLGYLYWKNRNEEKALLELEQALSLNRDYFDAHFMKGVIFAQREEKEKAKAEFEVCSNLSPENETIKEILQKLEKNESIFDIIKIPENVSVQASE